MILCFQWTLSYTALNYPQGFIVLRFFQIMLILAEENESNKNKGIKSILNKRPRVPSSAKNPDNFAERKKLFEIFANRVSVLIENGS